MASVDRAGPGQRTLRARTSTVAGVHFCFQGTEGWDGASFKGLDATGDREKLTLNYLERGERRFESLGVGIFYGDY